MNRLTIIAGMLAALCGCGTPELAQTQQATTPYPYRLEPLGEQRFMDHRYDQVCRFQQDMSGSAAGCQWACTPERAIEMHYGGVPLLPVDIGAPPVTFATALFFNPSAASACPNKDFIGSMVYARPTGIPGYAQSDHGNMTPAELASYDWYLFYDINDCSMVPPFYRARTDNYCHPAHASDLPPGWSLNSTTGITTGPLTLASPAGF